MRATLRPALVVLFASLALSGVFTGIGARAQSSSVVYGDVNVTGHSPACTVDMNGDNSLLVKFVGNKVLGITLNGKKLDVRQVVRKNLGDGYIATTTMSECNVEFTPDFTHDSGCQFDPMIQVGNAQAARAGAPAMIKAINAMTWHFFAGYDASGQRVTDLFRIPCPAS